MTFSNTRGVGKNSLHGIVSGMSDTIPTNLLHLGMLLRKRIRSKWNFEFSNPKEQRNEKDEEIVDSISKVLTIQVNHLALFTDWVGPIRLDGVDLKILAMTFESRVNGDIVGTSDLPGLMGDSLAGRLEIRRRLRFGEGVLIDSGMIQFTTTTQVSMADDVFNFLLDLDSCGDEKRKFSKPYWNRFRTEGKRSPSSRDDEDDPECSTPCFGNN